MPLLPGQEEAWVKEAYQSILLRDAEPAGLKAWVEIVKRKNGLKAAASGITASLEARQRRIDELYQRIFRREADEEGLAAWAATRYTLTQIEAFFLQSEEFFSLLAKPPSPDLPDGDSPDAPPIPVPKKLVDMDTGEELPEIPKPKGG